MEAFPSRDLDPVFTERGITAEIAAARNYARWTTDDVTAVQDGYRSLTSGARATMTRHARKSGGYVITRYAPPGLGLDDPVPEIRPDMAVETGDSKFHYHGAPEFAPEDGALLPTGELDASGQPIMRKVRVYGPAAQERHVARRKQADDHHGVNVNVPHMHRRKAKYLFAPNATVKVTKTHYHMDMKPENRAAHVAGQAHGGEDTGLEHEHSYTVKSDESNAKRLDVHPLAVEKIEKSDTVFFVIEGCFKADAVLSAGAAVFSVPSVTLWDADELPAFARRYLAGKTVVIVPDGDWHQNPGVLTQAMLCRSFLSRHGVAAVHVAAPPQSGPRVVWDGDRPTKGVDDFLGRGGRLADLDVIDRELPFGLLEFIVQRAWAGHDSGQPYPRIDRLRIDTETLGSLALHADCDGELSVSLSKLARIMDVPPRSVQRAVQRLADIGAAEVDGDLSTRPGRWIGKRYIRGLDWDDRPTITLHPSLRARDLPPRRLGDVVVSCS